MTRPLPFENLSWREEAEAALAAEAASGRLFDAYDLQERHGLTSPSGPNEWGPLFSHAAARGLITSVGFHQSRRPSRSGGICRIWQGTGPTQKKSGSGDIRQDTARTANNNPSQN